MKTCGFTAIDNFVKEIIEYCANKKILNEKEIYWINYYKKDKKCYNLAEGGKGGFLGKEVSLKVKKALKNRTISKQAREKMSLARKNMKLSKEHKKNIGISVSGKKNGFYGRKHTKETIDKLRKVNIGNKYRIGKKHTKETRIKMSANHCDVSGDKNPRFIKIKKGVEKEIINFYKNNNISIPKLALKFNLSKYKIEKILKNNKIKISFSFKGEFNPRYKGT